MAFIAAMFLLSFWMPFLYELAWILVISFITLFVIDILLLFLNKNGLEAKRTLPLKFSNSDENPVPVFLENKYAMDISVEIIDELPVTYFCK